MSDAYDTVEVIISIEGLPFHDQISHYPVVQNKKPSACAERHGRDRGFPIPVWEIAKPSLSDSKVKGVLLQGLYSTSFESSCWKVL